MARRQRIARTLDDYLARQRIRRDIARHVRKIKEEGPERVEELVEATKRFSKKGLSRTTVLRLAREDGPTPQPGNLIVLLDALKVLGHDVSSSRERVYAERAAPQVPVDRFLEDPGKSEHEVSHAAILFADLVDSADFKLQHTEIEGLTKTRLHNAVAEQCVAEHGGRVAKFLGDGVMAEFEGPEHALRAIQAGLAIIEAVETQSKKHKYTGTKVLETAVGVASGPVFRFTFPQSNEPDPQGTIVDLASRLCAVAGPQQLICSSDCFVEAGGESVFPNCSRELKRFVKRFDLPVPMRVVLPEGRICEDVRVVGHRRSTRPENIDLLKRARVSLDHGEFDQARKAFEQLVQKEPGNFEGNFRLAELLLGRPPRKGETRAQNVDKAIEHLRTARQVNPDSWRVWLMASWARKIKFEDTGDYSDLDWAIRHVKGAIQRAGDFMDSDGANRAKLELAQLHLVKSQDPKTDGAAELSAAATLCNEIEHAFNGVQTRRRSDCLATTALVLLAQGKTDGVKEMLAEAIKVDEKNPKALQAMAKFLESDEGTRTDSSSFFD